MSTTARSNATSADLNASSPSRAYRTATALADLTGLPIQTDKRLREIDVGSWEGLHGSEVREQNHELLRSLGEVQTRQDELAALNAELEDTNRGVLALYAELDDRARDLKRTSIEVGDRGWVVFSQAMQMPSQSFDVAQLR